MRSEWKEVKVGDLGRIVTGKTPKTAISENYGGAIPFLTPSDDLSVKQVFKTGKTLTERGLAEVKNCLLPANSICVSCIGSDLGKVVMTTEHTVTNQQINSIIPSNNFDSDFIYYAMVILGKELNFISKTSTAVPIVNKSSFSNYTVYVPPLPEQRAIAATLSCLDNKIELNNKINANLEAQAQAIFKSWFVDFEPFQDGEFADSEMGRIPKGWRVGTVKDVAKLNSQSYAPKDNWQYVNYLDTSSITENRIEQYQLLYRDIDKIPSRAKRAIQSGDIVYSTVRPNQRHYGLIYDPPENALASTGFAVIRCDSTVVCAEHIYLALITNEIIEKFQQIAETATSTFPACKPTDIEAIPFIIPDESTGKAFSEYAKATYNIIGTNNKQSRTLAALRDALLPKLMSSEIEIPVEV